MDIRVFSDRRVCMNIRFCMDIRVFSDRRVCMDIRDCMDIRGIVWI